MSDTEDQGEPTMEEILASIRRIISEDDGEDGESGNEGSETAEVGDEPIELTKMVKEDGSVVELNEGGTNSDEPESDPEPETQSEPAPLLETKVAEPDVDEGEEEIELVESMASESADDEVPPSVSSDDFQGLVSAPTAAAATSSISEIMKASPSSGSETLPGGSRTIEALVLEALRPELKVWLDRNLAALVERVVREEIKKMVRRVEDR